ncbi:FKBP-type peptidyl-prolyl cis-trans isomerase [Rubritalea spongiae]|uniref:Peptidyl-prolyl cis-trans isomerase n=1 Tax=Rubritalea spongiae TaxID=430797 RepID=A0ABW5E191_9BACT
MTTQEALEIVSYKLGAKNGANALTDPVLIKEHIEQAIADKASDSLRAIDAKTYMQAMKHVKEERLRLAKVAGEDFLSNNLKNEGVIETPSGLQYKMLTSTDAPKPTLSDTVTVHYHGTLIDGTVFESSIERGSPSTFAVKKVIDGWKEGLQLMSVGSKFQLFIPQSLAYSDRGFGTKIPPFATLCFELELIDITTD